MTRLRLLRGGEKEMSEETFEIFLKKQRKKPNVVLNNLKAVKIFSEYLRQERHKGLDEAKSEDIEAYVESIEQGKKSAKGQLHCLVNFFNFTKNDELLRCVSSLRQARMKKTKRVYQLKNFLNIDQEYIKKLATTGIKNVEQMLDAGKTKEQREYLAKQLDIPQEAILELVKLSDLTRLGYVKAKLSRLYYNSGLDSPEKIAKFEPGELHAFFVKYVKESGWDGMVPNPKDLIANVNSARKLKKVVED